MNRSLVRSLIPFVLVCSFVFLWLLTGQPLLAATHQVEAMIEQTQPSPAIPDNQAPIRTGTPPSPEALAQVGLKMSATATANDLALALDISASDLIEASVKESGSKGYAVASDALSFFPTAGNQFVILSSGEASSAYLPNNSPSLTTQLDGMNNSQGNDLVQLELKLRVPANQNCMSFDFAYYSEEFPEFVGTQYNDTFTAEYSGSNLSIVGNTVTAPLNFAYDAKGQLISVNTVAGVAANTGTTYDGATPMLTARRSVSPGKTITLVFSVQDLGDSAYDSSVFLDNLRWSNESNCTTGSTTKPPLILVHGFSGLNSNDLGTAPGYCDGENTGEDIVRYNSVKNNPATAAEYWQKMPDWLEAKYDVWIGQLKTGKEQGTPSLLYNAKCLREQVDYVYTQTGQPIILVAHSMGGLVSRIVLQYPDAPSKIGQVVTIQSPHAGLEAATIAEMFGKELVCNDHPGVCNMSEKQIVYTNSWVRNKKNVQYLFLGGDHSPKVNIYFGEGEHDGLVGAASAVGWFEPGKFYPEAWPTDSPPTQYVVDEVHNDAFDGPQFNHYRKDPPASPSYSYWCLQAWLVYGPKEKWNFCQVPDANSLSALATSSVAVRQTIAANSATINDGESIPYAIQVDSAGPIDFRLTSAANGLTFVLVDPSGQTVDPVYASSHPESVVYSSTPVTNTMPGSTYYFTSAITGTWQVTVTLSNPVIPVADYALTVSALSPLILTAETDKTNYAIGETLRVTASLSNNGAPVTDAQVNATINQPGSSSAIIPLAHVINGQYTGTYLVVENPGYMPLRVNASGTTEGGTFTRQTSQLLTALPSGVTAQMLSSEAINENGDSLFERLRFTVDVNVPYTEAYRFSAELTGADGAAATTIIEQQLVFGAQTIALEFSGDEIRRSKISGPYTLSRLTILSPVTGISILERTNMGETGPYTWSQFGGCFDLEVNVSPNVGGSVTADIAPNCDGGTKYSVDSSVQLTAQPASGFIFSNWQVDASGQTSQVTVPINKDTTVVANFLPITWGGAVTVTLTADPVSAVANGSDEIALQALVEDSNGNFVPGEIVTFTANLGNINPVSATTNAAGIASAAITTTVSSVLIVTAAIASDIDSTQVQFVAGPPAAVIVAAQPVELVANGVNTATVTATVQDAFANLVIGAPVSFTTNLGMVTDVVTTTGEGQATATLTAPTTIGTATVLAIADLVSNTTNLQFVAGPPALVEVVTGAAVLVADGVATTTVTATVQDAFANPAAGVPVSFTTSLGTITATAVTDAGGKATATLKTGTIIGAAAVVASTDSVSSTKGVQFVAGPPAAMTLTMQPAELVANGANTSAVTVTIQDAFANPVAGASVTFATDLGSIATLATTAADGVAQTVYTAGKLIGAAHITATSGSASGAAVVQLVAGPPVSVTLSFGPTNIDQNLASITVTALVKDAEGNPVARRNVEFAASQGTITTPVVTNAAGIAQTVLTVPADGSSVTVTATAGAAQSAESFDIVQGGTNLYLPAILTYQ